MSDATLTISFADEAGDGEAHWIRLERVETPDEGVTMEQAAALIDELYGLDPCEDGMGNGGEEADEEDLPEEEEFLDMARERLELDICDDESAKTTWETEVDVLRSHQDDGYSLQGERVEVGETTPMSKVVTETVEMNGASHDLQWPYGGGIVVSAGEVWEVRGSTVNFKAPVKGRVRISYTAAWDRVKLTVRRGAADAGGVTLAGGLSIANVLAVSGGADTTSSRENDSASVVAFWRDLAAECSLTRPPEDDQDIDTAEIERLCNRKTDWRVEGECWQTIERYNLCNCSGDEAKDAPEPEDMDAPCPEGVRPGSFLGVTREFGEYVDCPGEDKEGLNDPEFFRKHCCEDNPYAPLPRCRETREPYRGGKEIENGPEHWKGIYGDNVRLIPVTPEGGLCGELVKVWAVPEELEDDPVLPEKLMVRSGERFSVSVLRGGRPPFVWTPPAGVTHLGDAGGGFIGMFRADSSFRSGLLILVDACGREASVELTGTAEEWRRVCDSINSPYMPADMSVYDPYDLPDQPYRAWLDCPEGVKRYCPFRFSGGISIDGRLYWGLWLSATGRFMAAICFPFERDELVHGIELPYLALSWTCGVAFAPDACGSPGTTSAGGKWLPPRKMQIRREDVLWFARNYIPYNHRYFISADIGYDSVTVHYNADGEIGAIRSYAHHAAYALYEKV